MKASGKSTLAGLALSAIAILLLNSPSQSSANVPGDSANTPESPATSPTAAPGKPEKAKKKKKQFAKKSTARKEAAENKPPTQLPQYKRKTKVIIDFDSGSFAGSAAPTVVDRSQLSLAEAERERAQADKLMSENFTRPSDGNLIPKHVTRHKTIIVEPNTAGTPPPAQPQPQPMIDVTSAPAGAAIPNIEETLKQPKLAPEPHRAPVVLVDGDFEFNLQHRAVPRDSELVEVTPVEASPKAPLGSTPQPVVAPHQALISTPVSMMALRQPPTIEVFGPPAPPTQVATLSAQPSPSPMPLAPVAPTGPTATNIQRKADFALVTTPEAQAPSPHFFLSASYLRAQYSQLESDLQNGATSFTAGVSRTYGATLEGSLAVEIGQGLDQAITLQDTRFLLLRAGANYIFLPGIATPIAGLSLGYGNFNVFSYHTVNGATIQLVENAQATGLVAVPSAGVRLNLPSSYTLDLTAEYLMLVGAANASALGGIEGSLTVGIPF